MGNIKDYLDSTYLKTPQQSGLTEEQTRETVYKLTPQDTERVYLSIMLSGYGGHILINICKKKAEQCPPSSRF